MSEDKISLKHGAGGTAMMKLVKEIVLKEITQKNQGSIGLDELDDGATIEVGDKTLVFTTDSHTINPIFFPGGDIGRLAIAGTVNDLAVMGGKPIAMACAIVFREGFLVEDFRKICKSIEATAKEVGVPIVTGDTKVVERDALDEVIVTTTGVGLANDLKTDSQLEPGDHIIVTGTIGDHETAILSHREGIKIKGETKSDVAPIWKTIEAALKAGRVSAMKDPTRGGIAGALNELASKSNVGITLNEDDIPISDPVRNIDEMLGIDPLVLTNEGKAIIGVNGGDCDSVLEAVKKTKYGKNARVIGKVTEKNPGKVTIKTSVGGQRLVRATIGAPAPRIC